MPSASPMSVSVRPQRSSRRYQSALLRARRETSRPSEQQSIVEHRRVINAIGIADERVGEAAEIEQAIPIGVVAGEARDLKTEHDPHMPKRDFRREARKAAAFDATGAGDAKVFVDD